MIGIEFGEPGARGAARRFRTVERLRTGMFSQMVVVPLFHRHRILTQVAADNVNIVKLLPPLITGPEEVDYFIAALDDIMSDARKGSGLALEVGATMARGALSRKSSRSVAAHGRRPGGRGRPGARTGRASSPRRRPPTASARRRSRRSSRATGS